MTQKLNKEYIESLVSATGYDSWGCVISCYLTVGDSTIIGNSYCFDMNNQNVEKGKESAYQDAMRQLWHLEAYHLKRLRNKND